MPLKNSYRVFFSVAFPTLGMSRRVEEDLSHKGDISRNRKAGRSQFRWCAWPLILFHITKHLWSLLAHLAQLISQTIRPSSQLPSTFNSRVRITSVYTKSTADELETGVPHSLRRWASTPSLKVLSMSALRSVPGYTQEKADICQFNPQLHPPVFSNDGHYYFTFFLGNLIYFKRTPKT